MGNCRAEVRVIEIDAPSVGSLYYSGSISNFRVISQSLLFLKEAMLYFKPLKGITNPSQVERLASTISNNVELLTITSTFLEVSLLDLFIDYFNSVLMCSYNLFLCELGFVSENC